MRRVWVFALALAVPALASADQYWDGHNPVGNFSYDNNWYDDNQPAWGFGGALHFAYRNDTNQTSLYNDYTNWVSTDAIVWDNTFGAGLTLDSAGPGIDFDSKIENNSAYPQVLNMQVSGAKNGYARIELNPVGASLTIRQTVFNDFNKPYLVWGGNSNMLTVATNLAGDSSVSMAIKQYSAARFTAAQSFGGATNFAIETGELWLDAGGSLADGMIVALGLADANTAKFYLSATNGGTSDGHAITVNNTTGLKVLGGLNTSGTNIFGGAVTSSGPLNLESQQPGGTLLLSGPLTGTSSLTKLGAGTVTLSGTNVISGPLYPRFGVLDLPGSLTVNNYMCDGWLNGDSGGVIVRGSGQLAVAGDFNASDLVGSTGTVTIMDAGSVTGINTFIGKSGTCFGALDIRDSGSYRASGAFDVGVWSNAVGVVNQSGGTNTLATGDNRIGGASSASDAAAYGYYLLGGGMLSVTGNTQFGAFGRGVYEQSGGTASFGNWPVFGRFAGSVGAAKISGGTFNQTSANRLIIGEQGTGTLTVSGSAVLALTGGLRIGMNYGGYPGSGTVSLNGGTVATPLVDTTGGASYLNLNGGTLRAVAPTATFLLGLAGAVVYAGGVTLDTQTNTITVAQPLLAPAGIGIATIPVLAGGSGYRGPPIVQISGGGGNGAAAWATVSGGSVTGIQVTSPGTGYTNAPTITLAGGGATTAATLDTPTLAASAGGGVTKTGSGTLILTGNSTYTGVTAVQEGTLQINAGGSLYNNGTVAGSVVISNGASVYLNRQDTFGNHQFASPVVITVNQGGVLQNGAFFNNLNNLVLNGGELRANGGNTAQYPAYELRGTVTVGGTSPSSITANSSVNAFNQIELGGAAVNYATFNVGVTGSGGSDLVVSAPLINGNTATGVAQASTLIKTGPGVMTLSGTNSYSGGTRANSGTLILAGTYTGNAFISVNNVGAQNAVLKIVPGASVAGYDMPVGEAANSSGAVYQSGGALALSRPANVASFRLGAGNDSYGYYQLSGGALTANEIGVGGSASNTVGVMDITGGVFTNTGWITIGRGPGNSSGVLNLTGGSIVLTGAVGGSKISMNNGTLGGAQSLLNLSNAAIYGPNLAAYSLDLALVNTAGATEVVNLNAGGLLSIAGVVATGAGNATYLNFNGGTLKATAVNAGAAFMTSTNIDSVRIYGGGATIDDGGTAITVGTPLLAATDSGFASIAVADGGSGYIGAPLVAISGGTGSGGGTAVANMVDDGSSNGTFKVGSISITSPGVYTAAPTTVTLRGGGAALPATLGTLSVAANTSGGLTKLGGGTLTLSGVSTYTGATTVSNGTLRVDGAIAGGAVSVATNAAFGGRGTVGGPVTLAPGNAAIDLADGFSGNLTLGQGLTLADGNRVRFDSGSADRIAITSGAFTVSGTTTVEIVSAGGVYSGGTYDLITGAPGISTSNFALASLPVAGAQGMLQVSGLSTLQLVVASAVTGAYWRGGVDAVWSTPDSAGNFNWASDVGGATSAGGTPGVSGDAVFAATGASNLVTALGTNFVVRGLVFDSPAGVTIGGSSSLQINEHGIAVNAGAGANRIAVDRLLTRYDQLWSNHSTNALLVESPLVGTNALTTAGTGTIILAGTNAYGGATTVNGGRLLIPAGAQLVSSAVSPVTIADGGNSATMTVDGGTVLANKNTAPSLFVGGPGGTGSGVLVVNAGTLTTASELWVACDPTNANFGALIINGGSVTSTRWLAVGRGSIAGTSESRGEVLVRGGILNVNADNLTLGAYQLSPTATSLMAVSGGFVNIVNNIYVGEYLSAILDVSGGLLTTGAAAGVRLKTGGAGTGILNLRGGVVATGYVNMGGGGVGYLNFNGGTLRARQSTTNFLSGLTAAYVFGGGATLDTDAYGVTIAQGLLAPIGSGVTSVSGLGGSGYAAPPLVDLVGGGGSGATAQAAIDADGNLTGIFVTNPGNGYGAAPSVLLSGGGGTSTGTAAVALAPSAAGGLTKTGSGTLTLTGLSTYGGSTTVSNGVLEIGVGGAISGSATVTVAPDCTLRVADGVGQVLSSNAVIRLQSAGSARGAMALNGTAPQRVRLLYLGLAEQIPGTYGATGSGAIYVRDDYFTGTQVLEVSDGFPTGGVLIIR